MTQYGDPVSVTRELPVPLTDHELSALGQQLAARKAERWAAGNGSAAGSASVCGLRGTSETRNS